MPPVLMYIEKFGREVLIDAEHALAIAQRAIDDAKAELRTGAERIESATTADTQPAIAPAAASILDSTAPTTTVTDDGLVHGEPLALTDAQRTDLPVLGAVDDGDSAIVGAAKEQPIAVDLFALPPEQRELPAVQAHLEALTRTDLQALAKTHDIPANQSTADLVELLTLTLTTPAEPPATASATG